MANLTFRSILATGSSALGEDVGPNGAARYDLFIPEAGFDLSGLANADLPALLVLATKQNNTTKNFITLNAPAAVSGQSYEDARDEAYFVGRIIENPSDIWNVQVVRVPGGRLMAAGNILGLHSRNVDGEVAGDRDNFSVSRIFLLYFGSE